MDDGRATTRRSTTLTAAACLLAAACGGDAAGTTTTGAPAAATTTAAPAATTTTLPQEELDAALILAMFEELDAAAGLGPEAGAAALVAAAHPSLAPDPEHCAWEYRRIGRRTFDPEVETLAADPRWVPPGADEQPGERTYTIRVAVTDGEGEDAQRSVRRLHVFVDGDAAYLYLECRGPPPPPTTTTTTTIPPPPLTIGDAAGTEVDEVRRHVTVDGDTSDGGVSQRLWRMLDAMGVDTGEEAAAVLAVEVTASARGQGYQEVGTCYTGARVTGTMTLTLPDGTSLTERIAGESPMPAVTTGCSDRAGAPHQWAFEQAAIGGLVGLWGEGAVPLLQEVVSREHCSISGSCPASSIWDFPNRAAALDAFRGLDYGIIHPEVLAGFVGAAIDMLDLLVEKGWTDHGAKQAARRFLTTLSGQDFGGSDDADVEQWRTWYEEWVAAGVGA